MKLVCGILLIVSIAVVPTVAQETETPTETFYQRVDIQRFPQFTVQGLNVAQQIHYQVDSVFELYPADKDGKREALQTVSDTRLIQADALSRAVFTQSLADMKGRKFTYTLNKLSEIVSMHGHKDNTKVVNAPQANANAKGVLVSTVLDEDGWKELAQLTLFQPPPRGQSNRSFSRKTTHDWGDLGSWYGKTNFASRMLGKDLKRFNYQHQLEYIPPNKNAAKPNNLPFKIDDARFKAYEARGEIRYDLRGKRVTSVQEIFHARGKVATSMLGVASTVDIDEKQIFGITVTKQRVLKVGDAPSNP